MTHKINNFTTKDTSNSNFKSTKPVKKMNIQGLLEAKAVHSNTFQNIISSNIAQANIPKAKAKTVEKFDIKKLYLEQAKKEFGLSTTRGNHIRGEETVTHYKALKDPDANEITPVGNNIVLSDQMKASSENSIDHQTILKLMAKNYGMLRIANKG